MKHSSTYPTYFANPRRDGAIPATSRSVGRIAWSRELGLAHADVLPALLVWEGHIVAATFPAMAVFSPNGQRLWERAKQTGSPAVVANGLLYYENRGCKLDAVGINNQLVLENAPFPAAMNSEFRVTLLWPREKDFIATVYWPGQEPDAKTGQPTIPKISVRKTIYGERMGAWGTDYEGQQRLMPLFVPELDSLVIALAQEVISIDAKTEREISRFKVPFNELADWSADAEGILAITGYEETNKALVALSLTGQEKWRWIDRQQSDRWVAGQPPIRSTGQRVYALTDERILAFEQGKLLWQDEVKNTRPRNGSSLADGSLLVNAGRTLRHLDRDGKERFLVSLNEEILTPPVVDTEGNIYVATATQLVQIR